MSEELAVYGGQMKRRPQEVLEEAKTAAKALGEVVAGKKKPVIIQGEQYLEFEDWQTVGRFYGITAKIVSTSFIQVGDVQGYEAKAVAVRIDGQEVSGAEAMCLNDESNWKNRPLFMLRSMAQTRACAKGEWKLFKITTNEDLILQTFDTKIGDLAIQEKGTNMPLNLEYQIKEFQGK